MPIIRDFWLKPFPKGHFPNWICPECGIGILRPIEKTFFFEEDGDITRERMKAGEYFDYDVYTFKYSVLLKCNNVNCQERVSSCGNGYVREDYDGEDAHGMPETSFTEVFTPEYFYPPINIFVIPKKCPGVVAKEIKASFKLFFSDPPASANYIRKSVDAILTDKGIKRYSFVDGKRRIINLHNRILGFEKSRPDVTKRLIAIKWLGNEGSHTDSITKNDVLDAYEILEFVLDDLYVGYRKSIDKKVSQIIKTKKALHPST